MLSPVGALSNGLELLAEEKTRRCASAALNCWNNPPAPAPTS
jgi:hypothetical protein